MWSDSSGRLWVSEWNTGTLSVYDPQQKSWRTWALPGEAPHTYAVYVDEKIRDYIVSIVHATREPKTHGLAELADFIAFGASPRASIYLNTAARAHAFLRHRGYVTPEDIKAVGVDVLRHRVILTYEAEAEEITSETVVRKLFEHVEVP